jgi:serine/threonine protein kinase
LSSPEKKNNIIKLIDFGLAVQLSSLEEERQTLCGTPNYISPEVIQSQPYGLQTDLWSLGCILYALLTGTPPFECATVQETLFKIKSGKFKLSEEFSPEANDLISKLLTQDPSSRFRI